MKQNNKSPREALFHVTKRAVMPSWKTWLIRGIGLLLALIVNGLFIYLVVGTNPFAAYATLYKGAFGNSTYTRSTLIYTAKLLCIAVALAPAFKMRFWNIGAEGQVLVGALASACVMIYGSSLPPCIIFPLMIICSILAGAFWGFLPAVFKAKFGTNETLFTLMMNYVATKLVAFFYDMWKGPKSSLGKINRGTKAGYLPSLFGEDYSIYFIVVVALVILMYLYLKKTKQGYEIAVVGESKNTATYAGINVKKTIIRTMIISGAVCGLCGFLTVSGSEHTIAENTASGYGFTAIIVAWLAKFNTFYMAGISLFLVALEKGTNLIANTFPAFDASASKIVIGTILFFIIGSEFFINYKINFASKNTKKVVED